jgi:NAD(P)-dependent dehydrogenase (short-subunit alcohol dehydrogenase family)
MSVTESAAAHGRVAVVTGASRGAGKGIAIALGQAGATVYLTGRSVQSDASRYGGTVGKPPTWSPRPAVSACPSRSIMPTTRRWRTCSRR